MRDEQLAALDERERAARWRELLEDATAFVAQEPGSGAERIAGFCSLAAPALELDEPATGEVTALYVDPAAWRRGAGRALMDAAGAELRDEGCDEVVVWVLEGNHDALAFYAALGFAPDGGRTRHERSGLPAVRLRARLD
jgi:GNAT superfamily N-acetyltransferase